MKFDVQLKENEYSCRLTSIIKEINLNVPTHQKLPEGYILFEQIIVLYSWLVYRNLAIQGYEAFKAIHHPNN